MFDFLGVVEAGLLGSLQLVFEVFALSVTDLLEHFHGFGLLVPLDLKLKHALANLLIGFLGVYVGALAEDLIIVDADQGSRLWRSDGFSVRSLRFLEHVIELPLLFLLSLT